MSLSTFRVGIASSCLGLTAILLAGCSGAPDGSADQTAQAESQPSTSPQCERLAQLEILDPIVTPQGADAVWNPGEQAHIKYTIKNLGDEFYWSYLSLSVTADPPIFDTSTVTKRMSLNFRPNADVIDFAQQIGANFRAPANVPAGTTVRFKAELFDATENCPLLPATNFDVTFN